MATELAKAYVQILPTTKGLNSALTAELNGPAESAGKSAGSKIGSAIKGAITAAGIAATLKAAISEGMDLQQNLGGTEAVFGEFAANLQKSASEAYKNMGISASDYMATANKMGSLFQGSGIEQQKSLDLTSAAMQRAADVASVMGLDMNAAMESIAGAAKGNFTMMDNLGVAMNATTIQAYALERGINFNWNTSSQAEKSQLAMQMFFERTEQYAGNFARESEETLSGSLGAVKAAFSDVLGNLTLGSDIAPSLKALSGTVITFAKNQLLPAIVNIISAAPTALVSAFATLVPEIAGALIPALSSLLNNLAGALPALLPQFISSVAETIQALFADAPDLVAAALALMQGLVAGIIASIPVIVAALPKIIDSIVTALTGSVGIILDAAITLFHAIIASIPLLIPPLVEALPEILTTIITFCINSIPDLIDAGLELLNAIISAIPLFIAELIPQLPAIIGTIVSSLINNIPQIIAAAGQAFMGIVKAIPGVLKTLLSSMANLGLNLVQGLWNGIKNAANWVLDKIKGFGTSILNGIKSIFGIKSPAKSTQWMGKMLDEGLAVGIEDNTKPIRNAVDDITKLTTGTLSSELGVNASVGYTEAGEGYGKLDMLIKLVAGLSEKIDRLRVVLDSGELVGALMPGIDAELGVNSDLEARGVSV